LTIGAAHDWPAFPHKKAFSVGWGKNDLQKAYKSKGKFDITIVLCRRERVKHRPAFLLLMKERHYLGGHRPLHLLALI
jgi:hypothetical protein